MAAGASSSVPGASGLMSASPADQVAGETEEQRRKRLAAMMAARTMPGASAMMGDNWGAALGG